MRQDVAHVLVLITDGRAQDNVLPPSRIARALGQSKLKMVLLMKFHCNNIFVHKAEQ